MGGAGRRHVSIGIHSPEDALQSKASRSDSDDDNVGGSDGDSYTDTDNERAHPYYCDGDSYSDRGSATACIITITATDGDRGSATA